MIDSSRPEQQERAEDIAIVGMSCLFPGADSPARFWQNIVGKVDAICDAPRDWQPEFFYDPAGPAIDRSYTRRGGFLGELCRFHPPKYGVPPAAVEGAEPDQFIALKCAYEALADAGYPEVPLNRQKTGVILGRGIFVNRGWVSVFQRTLAAEQTINVLRRLEPHRSEEDFARIRAELKRHMPPANADTFPGLVHSALVGRIANRLDLQGPAYTVDAACSSTLLAVEHGIRELRAGRSDAMLVGGTQVSTPAPVHIMFCHLQALSREGKIAPFSAEAEGTVLGQGCGLLLLKRRADAERDGNRIYALLKSAGVSSDGKGAGLLAPRTEGQQLSIRRAYADAQIAPDTIGLVEAHGTGIPLGDGVEVHSLNACFGPRRGQHADVAIGSVKSMIGHLVPASGAASLIKTALALHHRVLPPTLNAETPNPALDLDASRFYVCNEARPWIHGGAVAPRRAGVNAFGFGGINAHVILEEYRGDESRGRDLEREWPCELVVISAANRPALEQRVRGLATWLEASTGCSLLDVAASCARLAGESRLAIVARDVPELIKKLQQVAPVLADASKQRIQDRGGVFWHAEPLAKQGGVALIFPGEGSQYPNMLSDLCRHFPEVRREFDLTSRAFEVQGSSLGRVVFPQPATTEAAERELFEMDAAVSSVTAAARGLWRLLNSLKIEAGAVVGHSSGEYAALLAAGAYRHQDDQAMLHAVLAGIRSAVELKTANVLPSCVLVSVGGVPEATLAAVLAEAGSDVEVAIDNCPHQRILAGSEAAMSKLLSRLQGKGGLCQRLAWDRPYHTEAFAPACPIVERYFDSLELCAPQVELWSCATAAPMPRDAAAVRELAVRQWRKQVRFRETIDAMYDAGARVFIECGPRGNLSSFVADTLGKRPHAAVALDVPNKNGLEQLCRALGTLAAHGVPMQLDSLYARRTPKSLNFDGPPATAAPREPVLPLALPLFEISDEVAQAWRAGSTAAQAAAVQTPVPTNGHIPPPASMPPALREVSLPSPERSSVAASSPLAVAALRHERQPMAHVRENGSANSPVASTDDEPSAIALAAEPAAELPYEPTLSPMQAAHREFQATMQQFLRTQVAVARLRGAAIAAPTNVVPAPSIAMTSTPVSPLRIPVEANGTTADGRVAAAPMPSAHVQQVPTSAVQSVAAPKPASPRRYPLIQTLLEHRPGEQASFEIEWDLARHRFLQDHTFFGGQVSDRQPQLLPLAVMPLAMSLELLAEGAALLCPNDSVVALANIRVSRWLAFAGQTRRVRVIVRAESDRLVEARLIEADGDGEHEIVSAQIELGVLPETLGSAQIVAPTSGPAPWPAADLYEKILYHGPAFQGIEEVDGWGPTSIRARVRQPDPSRLLDGQTAADFVLPVALIDTASQLPGLVNGDLSAVGACRTFAFPNEIARLEFSSAIWHAPTLVAHSTLEQTPGTLRSDTELALPSGAAVLRYLGKLEETVDFPTALYRYGRQPRQDYGMQSLNSLFAGVPGIERATVCEAAAAGQRLWAKSLWARVLAHLVLHADERDEYNRLKLPPVAQADWLLGRMSAKEAVRAALREPLCLADIQIAKNAQSRPLARLDGNECALVSYAHKTFRAVAVAARSADLAAVGIDCEPVQPLAIEVLADAFAPSERALLDSAAAQSTQPDFFWARAAWTAKEAVGKALGEGILGGPRSIALQSVDVASGRCTLELRGAMADRFPASAAGRGTLDAYVRPHDGQVIALCLLMHSP